MDHENTSSGRDARRNEMASLLPRYPDLDSDELVELLRWFNKDASALDVGLISGEPHLKAAYAAIKKDHLDRVNGANLFWMIMLVGGGFIAMALLVWSAL